MLQNYAQQYNQLSAFDCPGRVNQILKNENAKLGKLFTSNLIRQKCKIKEISTTVEFLAQNIDSWFESLRSQLLMIFSHNPSTKPRASQFKIIAKS